MRFHRTKIRYSIEPRDWIYLKGYGFLFFTKNMRKNVSNKYSQKILDSAKKPTTDAKKLLQKEQFKKIAEATRDLIGSKIADKIRNVSKRSPKELQNGKVEAPKKRHISPEEREQIIDELRLV